MMEFNFNSFGNSTQLMSYCDPEECEENKKLKEENELLKDKLTGLACFYETNKEYDKSCIERAKSNKCLHYGDDICRLDDIRNNPNRDCLRCIKESYMRLYSLNWDNQDRLIKENNKLKQALQEIKEIADGMHDLWINKTPYTDIDNLVKHLLECELNRIRYKFDDISEVEDE